MSSASGTHGQDHSDLVLQCALQALPSSDVRRVEAQISACADCRQEMEALRPIIDSFVSWPIDVLTIVMVAEAPCGSASTTSEQRRSRRRALCARRAFLHTPASFVVTWRDDARRGFYRSKAGKQHPARVRSPSDSCRSTRA